ncbi:hypothetical protein D3C85_1051440 [compost metagenome]
MGVRLDRAGLRLAADGEDRQLLHLNSGDGVQHIDLDQLSLACPLPVEQGRQSALEGGVGGDGVDQILAGRRRRLIRRARRHHGPRHGLQQQVLPRIVLVGAVLAIAGHGDVDQARIDLRKGLVIDPQTRGDARPVVLQEDIRRLDHLQQQGLALGRLQVDGQRPLVPVQRQEGNIDLIAARPARRDVALPFARRRLDLDHVGAHVAHALGGEGTSHGDGAVQHADSAEDSHCLQYL